jgi:hypothetical protein
LQDTFRAVEFLTDLSGKRFFCKRGESDV